MTSERQVVQLTLAPSVGSGENKVVVDGVDLTDRIRSLSLSAGAHQVTTVNLEYACFEGVEVDGVAVVRHNCPVKGEIDDA